MEQRTAMMKKLRQKKKKKRGKITVVSLSAHIITC